MIYVISTSTENMKFDNNPKTWGELKDAIVNSNHYYSGDVIRGFKAVILNHNGEKVNTTLEFDSSIIPEGNITIALVQQKQQGAAESFISEVFDLSEATKLADLFTELELSSTNHRQLVSYGKLLRIYCSDKMTEVDDVYGKTFNSFKERNYTHMKTHELLEFLKEIVSNLYLAEHPDIINGTNEGEGDIAGEVSAKILQEIENLAKSINTLSAKFNVSNDQLSNIIRRVGNIEDHFNIIDESREDEIAEKSINQLKNLK